MKNSFSFQKTEDIFEEFKRCTTGRVNDINGLSYARMRTEKGLQWPIPTPEHQGTKRRFMDQKFPGTDGKLNLALTQHADPLEMPDKAFPFWLLTGLVNEQYHSRTRTSKIRSLNRAVSEPFVEIHSENAKALDVMVGDLLKVSSRRGQLTARAVITDNILKDTVFIPYHFSFLAGEDKSVNDLTIRSFDESAKQPEYKAAAVKIEKA